MKRITVVSIITVLIIGLMTLCGCGTTTSGPIENTVSPWQAADEVDGQALDLVTGPNNYLICQFSTDPESRWIGVGYEYYEKGKLVKDSWQGESDLYSDKAAEPPIEGLLAVVEKGDEIQFAAGTGDMEFSIDDVKMKNFDADDAASGNLSDQQNIEPGKKIFIKAYATSKDVTSIADPQSMIESKDMIEKNDKTWLIYVMFSEKAQG